MCGLVKVPMMSPDIGFLLYFLAPPSIGVELMLSVCTRAARLQQQEDIH